MVGVFALAGHYVGNVAAARTLPASEWSMVSMPATAIISKASLFSEPRGVAIAREAPAAEPIILASVKSDILVDDTVLSRGDRLTRLIISPPVWKIEKSWRIGQDERRKALAERRARLAQHLCLARAIYFEARSESELGQLAVAKVILNRVRNPLYPTTICDVVYQGADQPGCQFSFACDGRPDKPRPGRAWEQAKKVAGRALAGDTDEQIISTATHFHADYVRPKWSDSMTRLIKIGRHIFYSGT